MDNILRLKSSCDYERMPAREALKRVAFDLEELSKIVNQRSVSTDLHLISSYLLKIVE